MKGFPAVAQPRDGLEPQENLNPSAGGGTKGAAGGGSGGGTDAFLEQKDDQAGFTPSPTVSTDTVSETAAAGSSHAESPHTSIEAALLLPLSVLQQWNADARAWDRHALQFQMRRDSSDSTAADADADPVAAAINKVSFLGEMTLPLLRHISTSLGLGTAAANNTTNSRSGRASNPNPNPNPTPTNSRSGRASGSVSPAPTSLSTRERIIIAHPRATKAKKSASPTREQASRKVDYTSLPPRSEGVYLAERSHGLGISRVLGWLCGLLLMLVWGAVSLPLVLLQRLGALARALAALLYICFLSLPVATQLAIVGVLLPMSCFVIGYGCLKAGKSDAAVAVPLALMAVPFAWLVWDWGGMVVAVILDWRRSLRRPRGMVQSFESAMSVASFLGPTQTPERAAGKKKEAANTSSKSNGNKQTLAVMQLNQWVSKDLQNIKTAVTIVEAEVRRFFLARVLAKEQLRAEQQRLEREQEEHRRRQETLHRLSLFASSHLATQWIVQSVLVALTPRPTEAHLKYLHPDDTKPAPVQDVISVSRMLLQDVDESCPVIPTFDDLVAVVAKQIASREATRRELLTSMMAQRASSLLVAKRQRDMMLRQAKKAREMVAAATRRRLAAEEAARKEWEAKEQSRDRGMVYALHRIIEEMCTLVCEDELAAAREQKRLDDEERARVYAEMRMTLQHRQEEQLRREREEALSAEKEKMRREIEEELAAELSRQRREDAESDLLRRAEEEQRWRLEKEEKDRITAAERAALLAREAEEAEQARVAAAEQQREKEEWEARQRAREAILEEERLVARAEKNTILELASAAQEAAEAAKRADKEDAQRRLKDRLLNRKGPAENHLLPEVAPAATGLRGPSKEVTIAVGNFFSAMALEFDAYFDSSKADPVHKSEKLAAANFLHSVSEKLNVQDKSDTPPIVVPTPPGQASQR